MRSLLCWTVSAYTFNIWTHPPIKILVSFWVWGSSVLDRLCMCQQNPQSITHPGLPAPTTAWLGSNWIKIALRTIYAQNQASEINHFYSRQHQLNSVGGKVGKGREDGRTWGRDTYKRGLERVERGIDRSRVIFSLCMKESFILIYEFWLRYIHSLWLSCTREKPTEKY